MSFQSYHVKIVFVFRKTKNPNQIYTTIEETKVSNSSYKNDLYSEKLPINNNDVDLFKCDCCPFVTKQRRNLKTHEISHQNLDDVKYFKCNQCHYKTKWKRGLKSHQIRHKNVNEVHIFKCNQCQYTTKWQSSLKRHKILHKTIDEIKILKCDQCHYQTKRNEYLIKHTKRCKKFEFSQSDYKTKWKFSLEKHEKGEVQTFESKECHNLTKKKKALLKHSKFINKCQLFKCDQCPYETKRSKDLITHSKAHADFDYQFQCDQCNYKTNRTDSYKTHVIGHKRVD